MKSYISLPNSILKRHRIVLCIVTTAFFWSSCSDTPLSGAQAFEDASVIESHIIESLDGYVMGYSYSISHQGEPVIINSGGYARNGTDGKREFRTDDKMHIAHLSQFITSVASIIFLNQREMNVDSKIHSYLPSWWKIGGNVENISFANLLTHQTGFKRLGSQRPNAATIDSIQVMVEIGSEPDPIQKFSNQNYAMLRILIPNILDRESGLLGPVPVDIDYGIVFRDYIRKQVIPLAGLSEFDLNTFYTIDDPVLAYYSVDDTGSGYGGNWNFLLLSGAFGYVINIEDMTNFWNSFWYQNNFINREDQSWIIDSNAGLFDTITRNDQTYHIQTGSWTYASNQAGQHKRVETIAAHLPGDWDIIIFTNSPHKDRKSLLDVVISSFDRL